MQIAMMQKEMACSIHLFFFRSPEPEIGGGIKNNISFLISQRKLMM